jgi:predicted Zn finger-like uncharacterized protein
MDIRCASCGRDLRIPEDKLPAAPRFKVRCPQCSAEIAVDRSVAAPRPDIAPARKIPDAPALEPEFFPPGARTVFLFLGGAGLWLDEARAFFKGRGYFESTASSPGEAIQKLRLNTYDVLLIEDSPENVSVLSDIAEWSGLKRREVNLCLVGDRAASLDRRASFLCGVNGYLNVADGPRAAELLEGLLKEYEEYYLPVRLAEKDN